MILNKEIKEKDIELRSEMVKQHVWQCCLNCVEYNSLEEKCGKYNARPPLKVVIVGCKEYDEDVPF